MTAVDALSFNDLLQVLAARHEVLQSQLATLQKEESNGFENGITPKEKPKAFQNGTPRKIGVHSLDDWHTITEVEEKDLDTIPAIHVSKTAPSSPWQRPDPNPGAFQPLDNSNITSLAAIGPELIEAQNGNNVSPSGRFDCGRVAPPVAQLQAPEHDGINIGFEEKSTGDGEGVPGERPHWITPDPSGTGSREEATKLAQISAVPITDEERTQTEKRLRRQFKRITSVGRRRLFGWQAWQVVEDMRAKDKVPEPTFTMEKLSEAFYNYAARNYSGERVKRMTEVRSQVPNTVPRTDPDITPIFLEVGLDLEAFARLIMEDDVDCLKDLPELCGILSSMRNAFKEEAALHDDDVSTESGSHTDDVRTSNRMDTISAFVIMVNAVVIGISTDMDPDNEVLWGVFELLFTIFFVGEMLFKMRQMGCKKYFLGPDWHWNNFDFVVVGIAIFDMAFTSIVELANPGGGDQANLGSFTIIKMARLGRLARLVRLLRFKIFEQLKMMIQGVIAGLRVLFWAVVLLFFFIYLLGVVLRKTMGDSKTHHYVINDSFESVPRSMFTLFRCFTDGCTAYDGTPLQVHLFNYYGAYFMFPYMLVFLFVTMGIFNLIMAIFIDNVMEASVHRKQKERGENAAKMELELKELIARLISKKKVKKSDFLAHAKHKVESRVSHLLDIHDDVKHGSVEHRMTVVNQELQSMEDEDQVITRQTFENWLEEQAFLNMLEDLDIGTSNKSELFDVLDCDLSGELEVNEVVSGLMKLRGPSDKSDAVASLLGIRYLTTQIESMMEIINEEMKTQTGQRHSEQANSRQPSQLS